MTTAPHPGSVTAVVPFYGDPADAVGLLRALLADAPAELAGVVVADDCSPTPFPAELFADDDRVRVVRRAVNGGFGSAVNTGLAEVATPLALVLNSDLQITGTQISALVAAAAPWQPVVASGQVVGLDGRLQYSGRRFPTVTHQTVEWLTPLARFREHRALHELVGHDMTAAQATEPTPVDWVMGALMLLPVEQVRAVGGFDESFHMNAEEVDLQLRLRRRGIPSVVFPQIRVAHEGGGSSPSHQRRGWLVTARFRYARKWGRPRVLRAALTGASGVNFLANAARRAAGRDVRPVQVLRQELDLLKGDHR